MKLSNLHRYEILTLVDLCAVMGDQRAFFGSLIINVYFLASQQLFGAQKSLTKSVT